MPDVCPQQKRMRTAALGWTPHSSKPETAQILAHDRMGKSLWSVHVANHGCGEGRTDAVSRKREAHKQDAARDQPLASVSHDLGTGSKRLRNGKNSFTGWESRIVSYLWRIGRVYREASGGLTMLTMFFPFLDRECDTCA